jgi:hypothetical protein
MLDSGWLRELRQQTTSTYVIALLVLVGLATARRAWTLAEPIPNMWKWVDVLVVTGALLILALALFRAPVMIKNPPEPIKRLLLKWRYNSLNNQQKAFLRSIYQGQQRRFGVPNRVDKEWWFDEMVGLQLVSSIPLTAYVAGMNIPYEIPVSVWKIIKQDLEKK